MRILVAHAGGTNTYKEAFCPAVLAAQGLSSPTAPAFQSTSNVYEKNCNCPKQNILSGVRGSSPTKTIIYFGFAIDNYYSELRVFYRRNFTRNLLACLL